MSILHIFSIEIWKGCKIWGGVAVCIKYVMVSLPQDTLRVQYFFHNWNHSIVYASFQWWPISLHELFKLLAVWKSPSDHWICGIQFRISALEKPVLVSQSWRLAAAWKLRQMIKPYMPEPIQHQHTPFLASDNSRSDSIRLYAWLWNWREVCITVASFDFALA